MPRKPADTQLILDSFRHVVQALRTQSRASERDYGLSAAQFFLLRRLQEARSALSINELAEKTFTHQSTVSEVIARLAEKGWVTRETAPEDRRKLRISLTSRGQEVLRRAPPSAQEQLARAIAGFPAKERSQLASLLTRLIEEAGFVPSSGKPPLFFEGEEK